jgi:antitoxin component YwqK of YwqJK toxin-antitoxin module
MKLSTRDISGLLLLSLFLISCYPKQKILVRFPDGRPKVVRHFKRGDTLHEKLVSYYDNGQKEYVKYWRNDVGIKTKATCWYRNGKRQEIMWEKLKDTLRIYNPIDSTVTLIGFHQLYKKDWYENGKPMFESYVKNGHNVFDQYDEQGIFLKEQIHNAVRSDGFDSLKYIIRRPRHRANK